MKRVLSANLLKYNANTAGNRSPDCVKRAISYAFDKSYIKVGKDLNAMMKNLRWSKWNVPMVYEPVIQSYGGSAKHSPDMFDKDFSYGTTLNEFADKYNSGSYVIAVGPDGSSKRSNHLVAVVNGEVIDSWDSREMFIKRIYKTNHEHQVKTDLWSSDNVAKLRELCVSECTKNVINFQNKLIAKYGWQIEQPGDGLAEIDAYVRNYQIVVAIFFKVKWGEGKENRIWMQKDVNFVFTPTTSMEEAESYIRTTAYTRLYDRFYELTKQVLNKIEENEAKLDIASQMGPDAADEPSYRKYVDGTAECWMKGSGPWSANFTQQTTGVNSDATWRAKAESLPADLFTEVIYANVSIQTSGYTCTQVSTLTTSSVTFRAWNPYPVNGMTIYSYSLYVKGKWK